MGTLSVVKWLPWHKSSGIPGCMDEVMKAAATARRNLAWRINKTIKKLEGEGREPTAWEAHYAVIALDHLELERYREGEDDIFRADEERIYNTSVSPKPLPADAHKATTAELRARLVSLYDDL